MSEPIRHHYIPIFYTMQWTGADGRLCEYSRPWKDTKAKRKHPSKTGYVDRLYTLPDQPPEKAQIIEKALMGNVDNWAAQALALMLSNSKRIKDPDGRRSVGWAQFLYSMIVRNPEHLQKIEAKLATMSPGPDVMKELRDRYSELRGLNDLATFEEYEKFLAVNPIKVPAQRVLPNIINSKRIALKLTSMIWTVRSVKNAKHPLLTSDRPVVMTNGLELPNSHVAIPISPCLLFIASVNEKTSREFQDMDSNDLASQMNNKVAEQAIKFVYGVDDSQLRFVANRLGKKVQSSPLG